MVRKNWKEWTYHKEEPVELKAGVDYQVKEFLSPQSDWLPLPNNIYTKEFRNNLVFVRNQRPIDPSFTSCPMPRRGAEQENRNAAIMMTYFHSYTLNPDLDIDVHVPYIGNLCCGGSTWHEAMLRWFDGNVFSEESRNI